jgi:polysaccharide pyruvyl transferase WcaK-like protein
MEQKARSTLHNLELRLKASSWCSKFFFVFSLIRPRHKSDEAYHFLLPVLGTRNIGDQAMVESFINHVGRDCVLIVEDQAIFKEDNKISPEPRFFEIPHLIYGNLLQNVVALISILRISHKMKSFSVIGADMMDGVYSQKQSINRLFLLRVINSLGINSRITGFSWAPNAKTLPTKLLRIISDKTKLFVRDPKSVQRLKDQNINAVFEAADLVFSDESVDFAPGIESWITASPKPIVTVNISGLGLKKRDAYFKHIEQYKPIVEYLKMNGFRLVILPHAYQIGDGDIEISIDLFKSSCRSEDLLITEPLSPAQERQLFRSVSFVITGKMHVAILALNTGTPVIARETITGKVQGLFALINLEKYCIDRNVDFSDEVIDCIKLLEIEYLQVCELIRVKIPELRQKSLLNFTDLNSM